MVKREQYVGGMHFKEKIIDILTLLYIRGNSENASDCAPSAKVFVKYVKRNRCFER